MVIVHSAGARHNADEATLAATNVAGTAGLLRSTDAASRLRRIVLVSSGGVYGIPSALPIREDSVTQPIDAYSRSKLEAETLACAHTRDRKQELVIGRVFNVVGPGQDEHHLCGRIASQLLAAGCQRELRFGSLHSTRDFVDVRDVAKALASLARSPLNHQVYNVASGRETCMRDLVDAMLALHPEGRSFTAVPGARRRPRSGRGHRCPGRGQAGAQDPQRPGADRRVLAPRRRHVGGAERVREHLERSSDHDRPVGAQGR